ncbi:MAG: hypothetical protein KC910_37450, partial [Candidatus Eremiobacteraeota bacterium]|nr:hypothetical protein [Candidatus Eremiobacteraeota bacterium]
ETAPPVYLRGIVEGKASIAYDVADPAYADQTSKMHVVLLTDHEAPDDTSHTITSGPGVPGGLHYADPNVPTSADEDVASASPDQLVVLSRGTFSAGGTTKYYKDRVHDADGNVINYSAQLQALADAQKAAHPELPPGSFKVGGGAAEAYAQGVFVADHSTTSQFAVMTTGGVQSKGFDAGTWSKLPGPWPTGARSDRMAFLIRSMRLATVNHGSRFELTGALSSLGKKLTLSGGISEYDYRLQAADADIISNEMGLPVSAVVCTWQRL